MFFSLFQAKKFAFKKIAFSLGWVLAHFELSRPDLEKKGFTSNSYVLRDKFSRENLPYIEDFYSCFYKSL